MLTILLLVAGLIVIGLIALVVVRGSSPAGRGKSGAAATQDVPQAESRSAENTRGPGLN